MIAAAIIESVAKTAWKNGVNVQDANGGPGSCFGRNKGCGCAGTETTRFDAMSRSTIEAVHTVDSMTRG